MSYEHVQHTSQNLVARSQPLKRFGGCYGLLVRRGGGRVGSIYNFVSVQNNKKSSRE